MKRRPAFPFFVFLTALLAPAIAAVPGSAASKRLPTQPTQKPVVDAVPEAEDRPYPGTLTLHVDATDTARGIFRVTENVPVAGPGPLTLLLPKWIPGKHHAYGPVKSVAGLTVTANGRAVAWTRDEVEVYAFHVEVPDDATELTLSFQFLSALSTSQGRIVATPEMMNVQWYAMSLYPAGFYTRQIPITASITLPAGWTPATALDLSREDGATFTYHTTDYDTFLDSPMMAGAHMRREKLAPGIWLNLFADKPKQLETTDERLQLHRNLAEQALKLFGGVHFDDYEFLFALSDEMSGIGIEHQSSTECGVDGGYFTDWDTSGLLDRDLLAHEFTHSWNGKYRRPAGMWTADFSTPMRNNLLWVYEGQTQFWGYVLATRAGLLTKEDFLGALARTAANYATLPGRSWRPLVDTTLDPVVASRQPKPWSSWMRSEDYYSEGQLVWLDVDTMLRERSRGKVSLDDFARSFFGLNDGDLGQLTYEFDEVVDALNALQPYDWASYLHERIDDVRPEAPLEGLERGGYRLVYRDEPNAYAKVIDKRYKRADFQYSLGMNVAHSGKVSNVIWDSIAFNAGLTTSSEIVAINDRAYDSDDFKALIKTKTSPINLLVKEGDRFRTVAIEYTDGLRYPHLEKIGDGDEDGYIDLLVEPKK